MPHFFLMNESEMQEADALLLRSRLHIRSFWTLMRYRKFAHGICTLHDGFKHALRWFILCHAPAIQVPNDPIRWTPQAYKILAESTLVTLDFDINSFESLLNRALKDDFDERNPDFDFDKLWADIEHVFQALEILPFDLGSLPDEDEITRNAMGIGQEKDGQDCRYKTA